MNGSFENQKADLWLRASLQNAKEDNFKDRERRIAKGIERIPLRNIYMQAQYLDEVLLPRIEKKNGKNSDYVFFRDVFKSLLWAVCLADRNEYIEMRHAKDNLLMEFYKQHAEGLERHLNKYAAMEDFFLSTGYDAIAEGMGEQARRILKSKNNWSGS